MVITIIILFLVAFIGVFFFNLYAKWFLYRSQDVNDTASDRPELAAGTTLHEGLEPFVLKSMPIVVFSQKDFENGMECVVCLCDVSEGQEARFLPKCNHGFHVDCIDMWFRSHSTCPLCRNPVSSNSSLKSSSLGSTLENLLRVPTEYESPNFPTNVLFWGNETQIRTLGPLPEFSQCPQQSQRPRSSSSSSSSSSSTSASSNSNSNRPEGIFVINIPRQIDEEEESKSHMPMQLSLFKRLLSRDRRFSPCRLIDFDME